MSDFAMQVWEEAQRLRPRAKNLWSNEWEDGMSETILRAIGKRHLFDGSNLAAWMTTIMSNLRRDAAAKGYGKTKKITEPRLIYHGDFGYASHLPTLDTPESILIAVESHKDAAADHPSKKRRYHFWDDESVRTMLILRSHGCSHDQIASHLGRTTRAIRAKIEALGGRATLKNKGGLS